jgi:hypothetical protein
MQTEEQIHSDALPVIASGAQSDESKPKRGGKRPGAGRKPNPTKLLNGVSRETLAHAVVDIDIAAVVAGLLRSKREVIRLQARNFGYHRMLGKAKQDVSVSGGVLHAHTRDPLLASLPREAIEALARSYDEILGKYTKPVLDDAQDGPHNQVNSSLAAIAEQVESEAMETEKSA